MTCSAFLLENEFKEKEITSSAWNALTTEKKLINKYSSENPKPLKYKQKNYCQKPIDKRTDRFKFTSEYLNIKVDSNCQDVETYDRDFLVRDNGLLKRYFLDSPDERVRKRQHFARYVQTIEDVFFILKCGNMREIQEGFDGAVALLAECNTSALVQTISWVRQLWINNFEKARKYESYWEILILGVACATNLSPQRKLELFSGLFIQNLGRATKAALIDALRMLEGKIDIDLIKDCLERFISKNELDEYIRNYAQEAIDDLS